MGVFAYPEQIHTDPPQAPANHKRPQIRPANPRTDHTPTQSTHNQARQELDPAAFIPDENTPKNLGGRGWGKF